MDFRFSPEQEAFRRQVQAFLEEELDPQWRDRNLRWPASYGALFQDDESYHYCRRFWRKLGERGWLTLSWPQEYGGRGGSAIDEAILWEEMNYQGAPLPGAAQCVIGPTLLRFGNEEQKRKYLPRIARGEIDICLGYSEPNVGSDLASVETKAVDEGDSFVIYGQKCWTSGAHYSDYVWLAARTDLDAPKHNGISIFLVDSQTPGITMKPVINMLGLSCFRDVFFDGVRVPRNSLIGDKNKGWRYLTAALDFERNVDLGTFRRVLDELVHYARQMPRVGDMYRQRLSRQRLAEMAIEIEIARLFYYRTAWMVSRGLIPGSEASVIKLYCAELSKRLADACMHTVGLYGQLEGASGWAPLGGKVEYGYLDSVSATVGAGTSEIQRMLIAILGLGLPPSVI